MIARPKSSGKRPSHDRFKKLARVSPVSFPPRFDAGDAEYLPPLSGDEVRRLLGVRWAKTESVTIGHMRVRALGRDGRTVKGEATLSHAVLEPSALSSRLGALARLRGGIPRGWSRGDSRERSARFGAAPRDGRSSEDRAEKDARS